MEALNHENRGVGNSKKEDGRAAADDGNGIYGDRAYDEHVLALLQDSGVDRAREMAYEFYFQEMDIAVIKECKEQDMCDMGIMDSVTIRRILYMSRNPKYSPREPVVPPSDLLCPILKDIFENPVIASDGETYEHAAILKWIAEKKEGIHAARKEIRETNGASERARSVLATGIKSPMGHSSQITDDLRENRDMKRRVVEWRAQHVYLADA